MASYLTQHNYLLAEKSDNVILLLNYKENTSKELLSTINKTIQQRISSCLSPLTVSVGISNLCYELDEYRENYFATKHTMKKKTAMGLTGFITYQDDVGINDMFYDLYTQEKYRKYSEDFLLPLLNYQANRKLPLTETLAVYLATLNIQKTAVTMFAHINTVKYRLKKIEELLNIDLNNQEDRMKLTIIMNINKFNLTEPS